MENSGEREEEKEFDYILKGLEKRFAVGKVYEEVEGRERRSERRGG